MDIIFFAGFAGGITHISIDGTRTSHLIHDQGVYAPNNEGVCSRIMILEWEVDGLYSSIGILYSRIGLSIVIGLSLAIGLSLVM